MRVRPNVCTCTYEIAAIGTHTHFSTPQSSRGPLRLLSPESSHRVTSRIAAKNKVPHYPYTPASLRPPESKCDPFERERIKTRVFARRGVLFLSFPLFLDIIKKDYTIYAHGEFTARSSICESTRNFETNIALTKIRRESRLAVEIHR